MFTGIVGSIGRVKKITKQQQTIQLSITYGKLSMENMQIGGSIAVNGVCLTVTTYDQEQFTADVMPETFKSTNLAELQLSDVVNLETAMGMTSLFDGHLVAGHVDQMLQIKRKWTIQNAIYLEFLIPKELSGLIIPKGSICLDGTSLTVFNQTAQSFQVSLIPHTQGETILSQKNVLSWVNVETDLMGKYVYAQTQKTKGTITSSLLRENGF